MPPAHAGRPGVAALVLRAKASSRPTPGDREGGAPLQLAGPLKPLPPGTPPRGGLRPPPAPHWHRAVLSQQLFPSPVTIFTHLEGLVLISVIFPLTTQPN